MRRVRGTDDLLVAGICIDTGDSITAVDNSFTLRFNFASGSSGGRQTFGSADRFDSITNNNKGYRFMLPASCPEKELCRTHIVTKQSSVISQKRHVRPAVTFT